MARRNACHRRYSTRRSAGRSEEHTSELQSHVNLVCRLLLEKKNFTDVQLLSQQEGVTMPFQVTLLQITPSLGERIATATNFLNNYRPEILMSPIGAVLVSVP